MIIYRCVFYGWPGIDDIDVRVPGDATCPEAHVARRVGDVMRTRFHRDDFTVQVPPFTGSGAEGVVTRPGYPDPLTFAVVRQ